MTIPRMRRPRPPRRSGRQEGHEGRDGNGTGGSLCDRTPLAKNPCGWSGTRRRKGRTILDKKASTAALDRISPGWFLRRQSVPHHPASGQETQGVKESSAGIPPRAQPRFERCTSGTQKTAMKAQPAAPALHWEVRVSDYDSLFKNDTLLPCDRILWPRGKSFVVLQCLLGQLDGFFELRVVTAND